MLSESLYQLTFSLVHFYLVKLVSPVKFGSIDGETDVRPLVAKRGEGICD
jgi:hypothetical protein